MKRHRQPPGARKRRNDHRTLKISPAVVGAYEPVVAAFALRDSDVWRPVTLAVLAELAEYVQPLLFGAPRVYLRGKISGPACRVHNDEVYIRENKPRCVSVYHDGVLRRRIAEGELAPDGPVAEFDVMGARLFAAEPERGCVVVYPSAGGARVSTFGDAGTRRLTRPWGVAAKRGRVYVTELLDGMVVAHTEEGAFVSHGGPFTPIACGLCVGDDELYVGGGGFRPGSTCYVTAINSADLSVKRRFGGDVLNEPAALCSGRGLVFVAHKDPWVAVFDASDGRYVGALRRFDGAAPGGVALCDDGTLLVAASTTDLLTWQLYAVCLL